MKVRFGFGGVVISIGLLAGCGRVEMKFGLSADTLAEFADNPDAQQQLAAALDELFGTPAEPKFEPVARVVKGTPQDLKAGGEHYRRLCMHCHGLGGDGNGPTAPFVEPKPRDYRRGLFKFSSTVSTAKPARADLLRTIKNGVPGTSMPSFALFDEQMLQRVLDYVLLLSVRGEAERGVVGGYLPGDQITVQTVQTEIDAATSAWEDAAQPDKIVTPKAARPHPSDGEGFKQSIARGKALYLSEKYQCFNCHGREARGDGLEQGLGTGNIPNVDTWGDRLKPANLTLGVFRGGGRPIDLFRRIHAGVKGGRMPAQAGNLTEEQMWDLVNYVRTLAYEEPTVAQAGETGTEPTGKQN